MFVVKKAYEYRWPVPVDVPHPDGVQRQDFTLTFKVGAESLDEAAMELPIEDLLRSIVIGWDGVIDEDGTQIPFSADALTAALKLPFFYEAVIKALRDSWTHRRGNAYAPSGGAS